ncbi:unnamed protein product [Triticum turgidum subsp. durum]|nr:unnamed protein product [Triticum turgidum subsp. durum]
MDKILERYERYSYAEKALISAESESESHLMMESISELQKKERSLQEENKALQKELVERQKAAASRQQQQQQQQMQWEHQAQTQTHAHTQNQPQAQTSSSSSSFMMRDQQAHAPQQNICSYPPVTMGGEAAAAAAAPGQQAQLRIGGLPPWMLSHLNA